MNYSFDKLAILDLKQKLEKQGVDYFYNHYKNASIRKSGSILSQVENDIICSDYINKANHWNNREFFQVEINRAISYALSKIQNSENNEK